MEKKVAIVTGGSNGIGKEIAIQFSKAGYSVIIADIDTLQGNKLVKDINNSGGSAEFIECDLSVPGDIERMIRDTIEKSGAPAVLVNNAGFGIWKHPGDLSVDEWDSVLNTNLRGAFLCARAVATCMKKNGGGTIINIASTRALMSEPGSEAYAASKGGLVSLTHALAASYSPDRIRVNCISPGWIETKDYDGLKKSDHEQHFSGRVGKPSDIARACLFLADNDFINGENIIIDGGMTRKMIYEP